jgi:hypothetical protein
MARFCNLCCSGGGLHSRCMPLYVSKPWKVDLTEGVWVIGGGAVGLAIARQLAARDGTSTVLIERNGGVGMETSSRNSEVSLVPPLLSILTSLQLQLTPSLGNPRRPLLRRWFAQNIPLHPRPPPHVRSL